MLQILYGINGNTIDVTDICLTKMKIDNIITIPDDNDVRNTQFSDHIVGIKKYIYVILDSIIYKYNSDYLIKINTENNTISSKAKLTILYGVTNNTVDVTDICYSQLKRDNFIFIPNIDHVRTVYFNDHLYGVEKKVFILEGKTIREYNIDVYIKINTEDNSIFTEKISTTLIDNENINSTISSLHSKLKINYGSFDDELPEQKMIVKYLTGNETVLEIGGNIGRTSLVIASILNNNGKLLTLECDTTVAKILAENRELNSLNFDIENSALSSRKLMQKKRCYIPDGVKIVMQTYHETLSGDTLLDDYDWVNTITLPELKGKHNIDFFDTLVLDCEGAFYYILMDMPEILENIKLIIMENDYREASHKEYIDKVLKKHEFYVDYVEEGGLINNVYPCNNKFYEVWKKHNFSLEK